MQHLNNAFNKFKMNDSTHVKMLIILKMRENSLDHSRIIVKHWVTHVSIYFNKCKMQLVSISSNILKVNGLIHVHVLIIEKMWKKSLICSNINGRF
jgi:hypothetical protein